MTPPPTGTRLAVWGDPIAHSRSPQLHGAAYAVLGLDWTYERRRVDAREFDAALAELGPQWRGLSVTMPLKERAFSASPTRDRRAELTGAVNTLLLGDEDGPRGFNTDVGGIVGAFGDRGVERVEAARVIGAGSTASSAVVALQEMGARQIEVVARRPDRAATLVHLGDALGTRVSIHPLSGTVGRPVDVTVATLPSGTELPGSFADVLAEGGGALLDAAYAPWPSHLGTAWERRGGAPISGVEMLLHQALLQVRIFVTGDVEAPLPDEPLALAAMRAALMGD
ncbi:shikimate dehydrogenase [Micromonospora sp. DT81.3]|uniref:shikimate dehydrogenase n=1 Tax=Micromonospora sp. DT81.3 TaxID=3416523 RepID=UPI003CFA4CE3